jgi:tRNA1(Val) A37 N6-methylase TrmN6
LTAEDGLLGGRIRLAQPTQGYRVAIDPVLLAASIVAAPGECILDGGCGSGAASLCLAARVLDCRIIGVERDQELAEFARRNVAANGLGSRIEIAEQDFGEYASAHRERFDQIMINPPFNAALTSTRSPYATKAGAHGESALDLNAWVAAATTSLKPGGRLTLIHRADRLADILAALDRRFGATRLFPLWPKNGLAAKRIIVSAVKGRRTLPLLLPGMVLHEASGAFTEAAERILRDSGPLALSDAPA